MGRLPNLSLVEIIAIGAQSLSVGRYCAVAAYTLQVYEYLICLADEHEYIHKARWSSMKVAYLICRYYALLVFPVFIWAWIGDHEAALCRKIIHPLYSCIIVFQLSAQAVMLIRTYAFTGRNPFILGLLCACFTTLVAAEIWLFGSHFVVVEELYLLFGKSGCFANDATAQSGLPYEYLPAKPTGMVMLGAFFFDFLMMAIVIGHCIRIGSVRGRLGKAFIGQGLGAFLVLSTLNLYTACLYFEPNRQWDGLGFPFVLIFSDVIACRLILDLRKRVYPTETAVMRKHSRIVNEALALHEHEEGQDSETPSDPLSFWT